jgi:hypothetical protein
MQGVAAPLQNASGGRLMNAPMDRLRAPRVDGKLSLLVRRFQERWAVQSLEAWENKEVAGIKSAEASWLSGI